MVGHASLSKNIGSHQELLQKELVLRLQLPSEKRRQILWRQNMLGLLACQWLFPFRQKEQEIFVQRMVIFLVPRGWSP